MSYDHVLVVGFGGPTRPEEVEPFIAEVARGARIPPARLAQVARNYARIGGRSPYNACASRLVERLAQRLRADGITLPIFLGMRCWHPFLREVLPVIAAQGRRCGVGLVLAPHRSPASFDRYLQAVATVAGEVRYDYVGPWHDHPQFIAAQAETVRQALADVPEAERAETPLVFSAHAIPVETAQRSRYVEELRTSCMLVARALGHAVWHLGYQSRSGQPSEPWLEPDVYDLIRTLAAQGRRRVVLAPIGFLFDHTEVLYDLDVAAREEAERAGMQYLRAATVMDQPPLVTCLAALIRARLNAS